MLRTWSHTNLTPAVPLRDREDLDAREAAEGLDAPAVKLRAVLRTHRRPFETERRDVEHPRQQAEDVIRANPDAAVRWIRQRLTEEQQPRLVCHAHRSSPSLKHRDRPQRGACVPPARSGGLPTRAESAPDRAGRPRQIASGASSSPAQRRSGPRNQASTGTENPIFGVDRRAFSGRGDRASAAAPTCRRGLAASAPAAAATTARRRDDRAAARALPGLTAMLARSIFASRSSGR